MKIKLFNSSPPAYKTEHVKTKLTEMHKSYISGWLLLVSVILQISDLEAISVFGRFFFKHHVFYSMGRDFQVMKAT